MVSAGDSGPGDGLRIQLLGGFQVSLGARGIDDAAWRLRKVKALIKLLALAPGHSLAREHLMDLLWENLEPDAASNNFRKALHIARHALEPELSGPSRLLHVQGDVLVLKPEGPLWVGVEAFEAAAAAARRSRDPHRYEGAVDLYRGDLLPEDPYEDWAVRRRDALREEYTAVLLELAELYEARGDPARAIGALRRVVTNDPVHEEAHAALMRLYAQTGQRHQALRQYQRLSDALRQELDAAPDAAATELHRRIMTDLASAPVPAPYSAAGTASPGTERAMRVSRLVGRDREMDRLEEALDTLFEGQGELILLIGEAGVGKSRLALEVARRAMRRGALSLGGAAYDYEQQLAYGPFVEALVSFAGQIQSPELHALLEGIAPEITLLAPAIGLMLGTSHAPDAGGTLDRHRLFAAVAALLARLEARSPVVIVLDDLHAADEASLQLLHYIARAARRAPRLLIATVRSDELAESSRLAQLLTDFHRAGLGLRLDLSRLGRRDSAILVTTLLGNGPSARKVAETVYDLAAGNPLYTEEAVRTLREGGQLQQVDGRWQLATSELPVPGPLAERMVARVARLGATSKQALETLAVVGQDASYPLLQRATDLPEAAMLDAMNDCLRRNILEESPRGYRFGHPLYRAALYERLSQARRASLHGRIAQAIETLYPAQLPAHAEVLAHHHGLSHAPGRAVPHLIVAGNRAASVYANEAAIHYYRRALDLLHEPGAPEESTPETLAGLWEKVGDLYALVGEAGQDVAAYGAAIDATRHGAARNRLARLHRKAAYAYLVQHDAGAGEPHLLAAEALVPVGADEDERGQVRRVRAHWLWERGRTDEALAAAEDAVTLAERHGGPAEVAAAHEILAIVFHTRGEWKSGLHAELQRLGPAVDDPQLARMFDLHHCIGEYQLAGDASFDGVEEYARRTLDLAGHTGARRAQAFASCLLGESLLLRGRWDEAGGSLRRSTELHHELGARSGALSWQRLAELAVCRGDSAAAEQYIDRGMTIAALSPMAAHVWGRLYATAALDALEEGAPADAVKAVHMAAEAAARHGDCPSCSALLHPLAAEAYAAFRSPAEVEDHLRAAEQILGYAQSACWRAMAETTAGFLALARDEPMDTWPRFLAAATLYERVGQPFWAARSLLDAGLTCLECDGAPEGRGYIERALAIFRILGATRAAARAARELSRLAC
jgi:DNA-binding SARP family transcriptional activator